MTRLVLPLLLSALASACAAPTIGESRSTTDNAIRGESENDEALCALRDAYLKADAKALKAIDASLLSESVSRAVKKANGGQAPERMALFSAPSVGTVIVAASASAVQLFTSKGVLLASFAIAGEQATFSEAVDCATRQPSGTGPDLGSAAPVVDESADTGDVGGDDTTGTDG